MLNPSSQNWDFINSVHVNSFTLLNANFLQSFRKNNELSLRYHRRIDRHTNGPTRTITMDPFGYTRGSKYLKIKSLNDGKKLIPTPRKKFKIGNLDPNWNFSLKCVCMLYWPFEGIGPMLNDQIQQDKDFSSIVHVMIHYKSPQSNTNHPPLTTLPSWWHPMTRV